MSNDLSQEEREIRTRNRHRMIGAAILTLLLVVVVPQFLEHAIFPKAVKNSAGTLVGKGAPATVAPAPEPVAPVAGPVTITEIPSTSPIATGGAPVTLPATESTASSAPAAPAAPASAVAPNQRPTATTPSGKKPREDHVSSAEAAAGEVNTAAPAKGVLLQAGVFHSEAKANGLSQKLNDQGFHSRVEKQGEAGKPIYRVLLGPMKSRAEVAEVKARLEQIQVSVMVKSQK